MRRLLIFLVAVVLVPVSMWAQVAVRGETVHTMAGPAIADGVVLIRDGKIERVGPASEVAIPSGYETVAAKVVTPGLIDAHHHLSVAALHPRSHICARSMLTTRENSLSSGRVATASRRSTPVMDPDNWYPVKR